MKISDFGIARALVRSSVSGTVSGKPAYMSPEQTRGDRLDGRSDLYSAGVVLWEMLTGRRLFGRGRIQEIFAEIALGGVPAPSELRPEVPPALDHVVGKLLAVDRDDRYRRAEDALADLLACQEVIPSNGAHALAEALAERFHKPPHGSDGISVMAEDQATFDAMSVTLTVRTETEDGSASSAGDRATLQPGSEAPFDDVRTTSAARAARPPRRRLDLFVGAAAMLLLVFAWVMPLVDEGTRPPASSSASSAGFGVSIGPETPKQAPRPTADALNPSHEAGAGPLSFPASMPSRAPAAARPQREEAPVRRRPAPARGLSLEPAATEASGIIDLHLEEGGS